MEELAILSALEQQVYTSELYGLTAELQIDLTSPFIVSATTNKSH
jgi:MoxR-like ATPase